MKYGFLFLLVSSTVFAAGDGHGSVGDLLYKFVNFSILVGFVLFKFTKPLSNGFTEKSKEVENLVNAAKIADEKASKRLNELNSKYEQLGEEKSKLETKQSEIKSTFEKEINAETEQKISKLGKDFSGKLDSEKNRMLNDLNATLVDAVIAQASSTIKNDSSKKKAVLDSMLSKL